MNIPAVLTISLFILLALAKFYNAFSTIKKKGIKGFLTQKLIMLSVIAVLFGLFILFNPDVQIENPKDIVFNYISEFTNS